MNPQKIARTSLWWYYLQASYWIRENPYEAQGYVDWIRRLEDWVVCYWATDLGEIV